MIELSMVAFAGNGILQPGTNAYKATFQSKDNWDLWFEPAISCVHVRRGPFYETVHITQTRQIRFAQMPVFPARPVEQIDAERVA
jgi:hypothetical protein